MTKSNKTILSDNYIQEMLNSYADGAEKHKDDSKALLIDLLQTSYKLGKRINSFDDYKAVQEAIMQVKDSGKLSALEKLGLKQLETFVQKEYPKHGKAWLDKKQTEESEVFTKKQTEEKTTFKNLSPKATEHEKLSGSFIDSLLKDNPNLAPQSVTQLNNIKKLIAQYPNSKLNQSRLTIKNNLVCIDGYTLPTSTTKQFYTEMKENPEELTYPGYAKALLTFAADIRGQTFSFPSNRDRLQKGEIDSEAFKKEINTDSNIAILKTLLSIIGFYRVIPVGLDKDGYVIYAVLLSDLCSFSRSNGNSNSYCLVSAS